MDAQDSAIVVLQADFEDSLINLHQQKWKWHSYFSFFGDEVYQRTCRKMSSHITKSVFKCFVKSVQASRSHCTHSSNPHVFKDAEFCKLCYLAWDEWKGAWDCFLPQKDASSKRWSLEKQKLFGTQVCACSVQRQKNSVLWWELLDCGPSLAEAGVSEMPPCQLPAEWCLVPLFPPICPMLSSSLFQSGMARNGRNCFRTV